MDPSLFKFSTTVRVRNFEVDWQGIVHNAIYLHYFETARIEYLKHVGLRVDMESIMNDLRIVVVRNEINYRSPARFDELLEVRTRIARIRNTSFVFEGYISDTASGRLISENVAYHVWLEPVTGRPEPVNAEFRRIIRDFEGGSVEIQENLMDG